MSATLVQVSHNSSSLIRFHFTFEVKASFGNLWRRSSVQLRMISRVKSFFRYAVSNALKTSGWVLHPPVHLPLSMPAHGNKCSQKKCSVLSYSRWTLRHCSHCSQRTQRIRLSSSLPFPCFYNPSDLGSSQRISCISLAWESWFLWPDLQSSWFWSKGGTDDSVVVFDFFRIPDCPPVEARFPQWWMLPEALRSSSRISISHWPTILENSTSPAHTVSLSSPFFLKHILI